MLGFALLSRSPMAQAAVTHETPACSAAALRASIASRDSAMGHVAATVVLRNVSRSVCALLPRPRLAFMVNSTLVHVTIPVTPPRDDVPRKTFTLAPGELANFSVTWSTIDQHGADCRGVADALLWAPSGDRPMWLPLGAAVCLAIDVSTLTAVSQPRAAAVTPTDRQFQRWSSEQPCRKLLLRATIAERSVPPATLRDAFDIQFHGATDLNTADFVGQAFSAPLVWYDPGRGIVALRTVEGDSSTTTIYNHVASSPYGIRKADLGGTITKRGLRLGMDLARVRAIEGPATLTLVGLSGAGALHYDDGNAGRTHANLILLFLDGKLAALDERSY